MLSTNYNSQLSTQPVLPKIEYVLVIWVNQFKGTTQKTYACNIKQFIAYLEYQGIDLFQINYLVIETYKTLLKNQLNAKGQLLSASTIATKIATIKSLYTFLAKSDLIDDRLSKKISSITAKPNIQPLTERMCTKDEIIAILNNTSSERDLLLLEITLHYGLRVSEVCSLNWNKLSGNKLGIVGKGGKVRYLTLTDNFINRLNAIKHSSSSYFFNSHNGNPLEPTICHRILKSAISKSGVNPKISFHWLRHYHAVNSLQNGCDINTLRVSLGHSSLETTQKYLHVLNNDSSSNYFSM